MKSKRDKGQELEKLVLSYIKKLDSKARLSRASGASNDIGDINNELFYIECKNWDNKNLTMQIKDWKHLCNQIPIRSDKLPMYVFQNNKDERFAVLKFEDLMHILDVYYFRFQEEK